MSTLTLTETTDRDEDLAYAVKTLGAGGEAKIIGCHTVSDVLGLLLEGYAEADDEEAFILRVELAEKLRPGLQRAAIDGFLAAGGEVDASDVSFLTGVDEGCTVAGIQWPDDVPPLLVVSTWFGEDSGYDRPAGNVVTIDPESELDFMRQLSSFGIIEAFEHPELPMDEPETTQ